jgi:hypothetical protein
MEGADSWSVATVPLLRCVRELASSVVSAPSEAKGRVIAPVPSLPVLCGKRIAEKYGAGIC